MKMVVFDVMQDDHLTYLARQCEQEQLLWLIDKWADFVNEDQDKRMSQKRLGGHWTHAEYDLVERAIALHGMYESHFDKISWNCHCMLSG
jgi:hypothetical protein